MSRESDKPFNCPFPGCDQRFTNNDHLTIHQQKHELSLRLGAKSEVLLVDQTPTPTRFLRNCEETGLFQELDTNPFEQDFKHATRSDVSSKNEDLSERPPGSDDGKSSLTSMPAESGKGSRVTLTTSSVPVALPSGLANPQKPVPMATAPAHVGTATAFTKQKLLASIHQQEQRSLQGSQHHTIMIADALRAIQQSNGDSASSLSDPSGEFLAPQGPPRRRGRKPEDEEPEIKRQRFLERNRAAASRCRARKKQWMENLEKKSKDIDSLNTSLQQEVLMLRAEVQQLRSILIAHKDCPLIVNPGQGEGLSSLTSTVGVSLISQLAAMPGLSPLVTHPSPSVAAALLPTSLLISSLQGHPMAPDVAGLVEIPTNDTDGTD